MTKRTNQEKELHEQILLIQWCQEQDHLVGSINNGMAVSGWKTFNKLKRLSCADSGVPDVLLILNKKYRADNRSILLFIEMKEPSGKGRLSPEQNRWITAINHTLTSYATVAHGYEAAKDWIRSFYQVLPPIEPFDEEEFNNWMKKK